MSLGTQKEELRRSATLVVVHNKILNRTNRTINNLFRPKTRRRKISTKEKSKISSSLTLEQFWLRENKLRKHLRRTKHGKSIMDPQYK
jgi:hypothetical protein